MNLTAINAIFDRALQDGRDVLLDTEGLQVLAALGLPVPAFLFVARTAQIDADLLAGLPGAKAVVKVVSPQILHKSDVGGVAIVEKTREAVAAAIARMDGALGTQAVVGYTINEFVPYSPALGREWLVGLRWTDDVGPVVTVGAGGIYTEFLAKAFRPGQDVALFAPTLADPILVEAALQQVAVVQLATRSMRGQAPLLPLGRIADLAAAFLELGRAVGPRIAEFEVNPFVVANDGRVVALDVLLKLRREPAGGSGLAARPLAKLARLLEPRSAAIMGVSERMNPGHIIVNNLLREGFARDRILIVKSGTAEIEGCRCVPDIASIPDRVDLFVLCVDAAQASAALVDIIEREKAESVVLIPGGLEEKAGSEAIVARMHAALAQSRRSAWGGPLINGGNCLGIRSVPGRYDTTFIPEYKLPVPGGEPSRLAVVSQSGAFAVSKASKLSTVNPKYSVTLGNQMDLTVGDYLTYLKDDSGIDVFAVYVEGFRPLDGLRFLEAARAITTQGRTVILYKAGRTPAGALASASHTASIAGDYAVMRALSAGAGVVVAESLEDFEDLVVLFSGLGRLTVPGWRLAAVSNAGFECVAIADSLGRFTLPPFGAGAARTLDAIFVRSRIDKVVDIHNPIDLTPMTGDEAYADIVRALLDDDQYDAAVVGIVPLTAALNTLKPGAGHGEDVANPGGIVARLAALKRDGGKPWVVVVDAGAIYDPMVRALDAAGIPTFRTADRALRLLNVYCAERQRGAGAS
ncbi:MAG: acetate--CoA ligase family protein [Vicinamibacterales bacterium]|jgi:acyl-CoA synthetase (NDP forming)|nr:acetate--CoA ligase family protein [Vicinamibacterales bacterium]